MAKYEDFKSYIQVNYEDMLTREVLDYVQAHHDGLGFHALNVVSLSEKKIDNLSVKSLMCHDDIGYFINIDVNLTADVVTLGLGMQKYEADRKTRWFTVSLRAQLHNGLHDVTALNTEEYHSGHFNKEGALDEYLVPYIYTENLEDIAEDFYSFYCDENVVLDRFVLPYQHIMEQMGVQYYFGVLPDTEFGRMYFKKADVEIYQRSPYPFLKSEPVHNTISISPGTMILNENTYFMHKYGSGLFTIAHELIHWELHQKFFEILSLLNDETDRMSCEVTPGRMNSTMTGIQKAVWWAEWQANALAPRILMPRSIFNYVLESIMKQNILRPHAFRCEGQMLEDAFERMAELFNVSNFSVKMRAIQLGYDKAEGTFPYVDGNYFMPLSFKKGTLGNNQTFFVDRKNATVLMKTNPIISELVEQGSIVYTGHVFCINDTKYIEPSDVDDPIIPVRRYQLTRYANDHADECCLVFERRFDHQDYLMDDDLYQRCYLCQNVSAAYYREADFDEDYSCNQNTIDRAKEVEKSKKFMKEIRDVRKATAGMEFHECLKYHIERRKLTDEELAYRSNISSRQIGDYHRKRTKIPLQSVLAICIGLNLRKEYCYDLIEKAGYKLGMSDEHDVYKDLIEYHTDGNLKEWNQILKEYGIEQVLPSNRKK
ncbi:MAG: helix-turn-helix domain-containing protein [Lachnospiraceae bacterium]|nr:helix-turn-helix domain-containing protein [Lachnospiraceae bacterium]